MVSSKGQAYTSRVPTLLTERLALLPLSREMIELRLAQEEFKLSLDEPGGLQTVQFGAQWAKDLRGLFPYLLEQMRQQGLETYAGIFCAVLLNGQAVGDIGTKGPPNAAGEQEIGYGFIPSSWGQGYATEAVQALAKHLLTQPDVKVVTAQTAHGNRASERVLEKAGFMRTGQSWNTEDGDLTVWGYRSG